MANGDPLWYFLWSSHHSKAPICRNQIQIWASSWKPKPSKIWHWIRNFPNAVTFNIEAPTLNGFAPLVNQHSSGRSPSQCRWLGDYTPENIYSTWFKKNIKQRYVSLNFPGTQKLTHSYSSHCHVPHSGRQRLRKMTIYPSECIIGSPSKCPGRYRVNFTSNGLFKSNLWLGSTLH